MPNRFNEFLALHHQQEALLIGNAWNAQSAKILAQQGWEVIGTSSVAVAESLGFADGEEMGFDLYLKIIEGILRVVPSIVTVDLESGYGETAEEIAANIKTLYAMGVSGINIEDSIITNGERKIQDANVFAARLQQVCRLLKEQDIRMFINVRSDSFLLGLPNAPEDALARAKAYQHTGVHGLFFPCITNLPDIEAIVKQSVLPVNVMCVPGLPDFGLLERAGVKRISIGPFLYMHLYGQLETAIKTIKGADNFSSLFHPSPDNT
nr:isocitrate lyase/phosphoenolpyruvate mutase family protein [uncultured Mucilaginibacter sp.]